MAIDWDALVLGPVMGIFGAAAVWTPKGGAPVPLVDAVFDQQAEEQAIIDDEIVIRRRPVLGVHAAALGGACPAQGDLIAITANGQTYVVKDALPDGHGHILLKLMRTAA